jgi:hypothetical protein
MENSRHHIKETDGATHHHLIHRRKKYKVNHLGHSDVVDRQKSRRVFYFLDVVKLAKQPKIQMSECNKIGQRDRPREQRADSVKGQVYD